MRKQCKRRIWSTSINAVQLAIEGAAVTPENALNQLRLRELAAIESFRTGAATLQDWSDIKAILNLCETMAKGGIGPEALQACKAAEETLIAAAKRFEATRRMITTGQGLESFRELYRYHDIQRQSVTRGEYERWIRKTVNVVRSKAPGVRDMAQV